MSQAAHDSQMARLRDAEEAFERCYDEWKNTYDQIEDFSVATEEDWALIAYEMGVTDCYKRIK